MGRRCFCIALVLLFCIALVSPCFASDNTIGEIQQDLEFLGFSVGSLTYDPYYVSTGSNVVDKFYSVYSDVDLADQEIYFYFRWPEDAAHLMVSGTLGISAQPWSSVSPASINFYGCHRLGYNSIDATLISTQIVGMTGFSHGISLKMNQSVELQNDDYYYLVLGIPTALGTLVRSLTFSEAVASKSMTLSPSSGTSKVSLTGLVGFRSIPAGYVKNSTLDTTSNFVGALLHIVPFKVSDHSALYFPSTSTLSDLFGGVSFSTDRVDSDALIRTNASGTVNNPSYRASYSSGGAVEASAASDVMAYGFLSAWYGDDGGLVDTVKHMDGTLDGIAEDMAQILEDVDAEDDFANDVGGAATDDDIADADATLSTGLASLDAGAEVAGDVGAFVAPAAGYIQLMTATVGPLLNFGNGVMYWAVFAVLIAAVLIFIIRRLS